MFMAGHTAHAQRLPDMYLVPARDERPFITALSLFGAQVHGAVEPFWLLVEDADSEVGGWMRCFVYRGTSS